MSRYSGPLLRTRAELVKREDDNRNIVERLYRAMHEWDGIGLAAPQIGIGMSVAVIEWSGQRYDCLNLRIERPTMGMVEETEGCLSLPNRLFKVTRHIGVWAVYRTPTWAVRRIWVEDYLGRVFQHEADHLLGKCIDQVGIEISQPKGPVITRTRPSYSTD